MDWFIELNKYKQTSNYTATENFLTTALVGVLNADFDLSRYFTQKIFRLNLDIYQFNYIVQSSFNDKSRPDIKLECYDVNKKLIFIGYIECKVDSSPDSGQLLGYERNLKKLEVDYLTDLCYIGRYPKPKFETSAKLYTWWDVHYILKEFVTENITLNYLITEFKKLMDFNNLTPPVKIGEDWVTCIDRFYFQINNLSKVFETICDNFSRIQNFSVPKNVSKSSYSTVNSNYYGYFNKTLQDSLDRSFWFEIGWNLLDDRGYFYILIMNIGNSIRFQTKIDIEDLFSKSLDDQILYLYDNYVELLNKFNS